MIFDRSHPGIAFINILLICSFLKSSAACSRASLVAVSLSSLVCSAAAGAGSSPAIFSGATSGKFGSGYALKAFDCRFTRKFSGVSVIYKKVFGRVKAFDFRALKLLLLANLY